MKLITILPIVFLIHSANAADIISPTNSSNFQKGEIANSEGLISYVKQNRFFCDDIRFEEQWIQNKDRQTKTLVTEKDSKGEVLSSIRTKSIKLNRSHTDRKKSIFEVTDYLFAAKTGIEIDDNPILTASMKCNSPRPQNSAQFKVSENKCEYSGDNYEIISYNDTKNLCYIQHDVRSYKYETGYFTLASGKTIVAVKEIETSLGKVLCGNTDDGNYVSEGVGTEITTVFYSPEFFPIYGGCAGPSKFKEEVVIKMKAGDIKRHLLIEVLEM